MPAGPGRGGTKPGAERPPLPWHTAAAPSGSVAPARPGSSLRARLTALDTPGQDGLVGRIPSHWQRALSTSHGTRRRLERAAIPWQT